MASLYHTRVGTSAIPLRTTLTTGVPSRLAPTQKGEEEEPVVGGGVTDVCRSKSDQSYFD